MRRSLSPLLLAALCAVLLTGASPAGARSAAAATASGATISGTVRGPSGDRGLYGMRIAAAPSGQQCAAAGTCPATAISGPDGHFALTGLAPGSYTVVVLDGSEPLQLRTVSLASPDVHRRVALRLPAPAVPAGTVPRNSERDLAWLNAERVRSGLPGGVALNPRWSAQCAAHDGYERVNDVLATTEDPNAAGASAGGAWAGLDSVLAQDRWTASASPWENAPIHLLSLLAPSLSVTGIDDSDGRQCAVTSAGLLRTPGRRDVIHTVPATGARGVIGSELAREAPFAPPQFVGLPAGRPTGRELLIYLNRAGTAGQSPVQIVSAALTRAGRHVAVRWVDATTPRLGPYLLGGIVIPVSPLAAATTYRATVSVRAGGRTLTRAWHFTTRAGQSS